MQDCLFIITDSGGIQEEAPYLGKKVLVLRDESERKELLLANKFLQGTIKEEAPYGNGSAARKIGGVLELGGVSHLTKAYEYLAKIHNSLKITKPL